MTSVTLDGLEEEQFRRLVEAQLRQGRANEAIARLQRLLAPYAAPGGILPERFLSVSAAELELAGWEGLGDALERHDRPERPVTALSLSFGWPGEEACPPDANGLLAPYVEVAFYSDEAFPFSSSTREDLLEGYSYHGCTWAGDCVATETTVTLGGIDDLHGALAALEAELLSSEEPDEDKIKAGSLAACLLSALLFQAVAERIARDRLPRPLCITAGSNGVYPYFDAPVAGMPEDLVREREAAAEAALDTGVPGPRFSSLLMTSIPRARKRAVLVLEEDKDQMAQRIASLRGLPGDEDEPEPYHGDSPESEPVISPAPNGPLLVKKAPRRELVDAHAGDEPGSLLTMTPPVLLHDPLPELDDEIAEPEPEIAAPEPAPVTGLQDYDTQERLQLLVARHLTQDLATPGAVNAFFTEDDVPAVPEPDAPPAPPALRIGYDWSGNDAMPMPRQPAPPAAAPVSLLGRLAARLRGWFGRS